MFTGFGEKIDVPRTRSSKSVSVAELGALAKLGAAERESLEDNEPTPTGAIRTKAAA